MRRLVQKLSAIFGRVTGQANSTPDAPHQEPNNSLPIKRFHFSDLHSFKDFVVFVRMCSPSNFPHREGRSEAEQWTLDLAFDGLQEGLDLSIREKGNRPQFERVRQLFDEAYRQYRLGDINSGFKTLDLARKLLGEVPSR